MDESKAKQEKPYLRTDLDSKALSNSDSLTRVNGPTLMVPLSSENSRMENSSKYGFFPHAFYVCFVRLFLFFFRIGKGGIHTFG